MAEKSYHARGIVLKKTKLKETDLIVTLMRENGQAIRAVAKGARKPSSSFSSRLEPGSVVDVLVARGRGDLHIIQEARLVASHESSRETLERTCVMTASLELLARVCQPDITVDKLYAMTCVFLDALAKADNAQALALGAAHMLKASAFLGYRPSFDMCVVCGCPLEDAPEHAIRYLSIAEGGVVCPACQTSAFDAQIVTSSLISWMQFLLMSSFATIAHTPPDVQTTLMIYEFLKSWIKTHGAIHLKALDFVLTLGLYD